MCVYICLGRTGRKSKQDEVTRIFKDFLVLWQLTSWIFIRESFVSCFIPEYVYAFVCVYLVFLFYTSNLTMIKFIILCTTLNSSRGDGDVQSAGVNRSRIKITRATYRVEAFLFFTHLPVGPTIFLECQDYRSMQRVIYESSPSRRPRLVSCRQEFWDRDIATRHVARFDIRDQLSVASCGPSVSVKGLFFFYSCAFSRFPHV